MKIRTDFVTNSSSSSFVLEIRISLTNGENLVFLGTGSEGEGAPSDFGDLLVSVSPRQLGTAANISQLTDMLKAGVVDHNGFGGGKEQRIFDSTDPERNYAAAMEYGTPRGESYNQAIRFIDCVERIPDMEQIQSVTIRGDETGQERYWRTYQYDRKNRQYTRKITGHEFEKNGGSGGDLIFSDAGLAVDPKSLILFEFSPAPLFLNFKNRKFATTGFSESANRELYRIISERGGQVVSLVSSTTYCLVVNPAYGSATEKYLAAVEVNQRSEPGYRVIILSAEQFRKYAELPEGELIDPQAKPYLIESRRLYDVSAQVKALDLRQELLNEITPTAFSSCTNLTELALPVLITWKNTLAACPLQRLTLVQGDRSFRQDYFGSRPMPEVEMPLFSLRDCVYTETKAILIDLFLRRLARGEAVDDSLREEYNAYLKGQRKKFYENDAVLKYMAQNALIPQKEAMPLAESARSRGDLELARILEACAAVTKKTPAKTKVKTAAPAEDKLWRARKQTDGTLIITLYCGTDTDVTVPTTLRGLPVTAVGKEAFSPEAKGLKDDLKEARRKLRSLVIPDAVRIIEEFGSCPSLEELTLPGELEQFAGFSGLTGIKKLHAPASFYRMRNAFRGWPHASIEIPPEIDEIGCSAFFNSKLLQQVVAEEGLTTIGEDAFYGCENLSDVSLPESVVNIGSGAFRGCKGLADSNGLVIVHGILFDYFGPGGDVAIPDGVTRIDDGVFQYKAKLTHITVPASLTDIGAQAFYGQDGLADENGFVIINGILLGYCGPGGFVSIPDNVTRIDEKAFWMCQSLTDVSIPERVKNIGSGAFHGCKGLANADGFVIKGGILFDYAGPGGSVTVPEGVSEIDGGDYYGAFMDCRNLTSITLPSSLRHIGRSAFYNCSGLTDVTVPSGVTDIGHEAFYGCSNLTSISIPETVNRIDGWTFFGCRWLTICAPADSYAEQYAREQKIPFKAI